MYASMYCMYAFGRASRTSKTVCKCIQRITVCLIATNVYYICTYTQQCLPFTVIVLKFTKLSIFTVQL